MFASQSTQTIPLPFAPGQTVTIHKLSGKDYDGAQFEHMTGVTTGRGRNWATTFLRLAAAGTATPADAAKVLQDPLSGFDRLSLVKSGLVGWTFEEDGKPKPVTAEAINDIEDEPLEFLATAVLRLTKPARFLTTDEVAADRKNDSAVSTAP